MSKFKVGDKVKIKRNICSVYIKGHRYFRDCSWNEYGGEIATIEVAEEPFRFGTTRLYRIDLDGRSGIWDDTMFEGTFTKKVKREPIKLHAVFIDLCNNFVCINKSYKEAETRAKDEDEAVTIYRLVKVANVTSHRRVKKVRPKKIKSKKTFKRKK